MAFLIQPRLPDDLRARGALIFRFLVWPAAAWSVAGTFGPGSVAGLPLPLAGALLALAAVAAVPILPARLHPLAAPAEAALAGAVVATLGGQGSPWLLLFPWLVLDHGSRPGHRLLVLSSVPAAYTAAVGWTGGVPPWHQLVVHAGVYVAAALYAVVPRSIAVGSESQDDASEASVIRLQDRVLALFGSLAEQEVSGAGRPDSSRGARALARALHALLHRQRAEGEPEVTFRHFDPADLLESACEEWAACALVRGLDIQGWAAFDAGAGAFGDLSRTTRILDLMLLAGCFSATSGTMRLTGRLVEDAGSEPMIEFTLEVAGEVDEEFVAWRVRNTLKTRVAELGGGSRFGGSPTHTPWQARLPVELEVRREEQPGRLSDVPLYVRGDSILREVMAAYASDEGAVLVDEPGDARVILLARSPHDPEVEADCQDLKQAHPSTPVLCQGSNANTRASLMLDADGLIPVPFSRREFAGLVNRHLSASPAPQRPRPEHSATPSTRAHEVADREAGSVLVAEDDAISARVVTKFLEAEGCRVLRVQDGEAALNSLCGGLPALALLDMHMPGLDGVEVARKFREWEREKGRDRTPLVALTASAADADRRACREAGMDGFINKPVDRKALREILARYLPNEGRERPRSGVSGVDHGGG